jgi:hypothetical protein
METVITFAKTYPYSSGTGVFMVISFLITFLVLFFTTNMFKDDPIKNIDLPPFGSSN